MNKALVFIGSPYSRPSVSHNVHNAAMEFNWLVNNLGDKIVPISMVIFSSYQDVICPRGYEEWLSYCIDVMKKCDIYYAMPGVSSGMDREIEICKAMKIPIVKSRDELSKYLEDHQEILDSNIDRIRKEVGAQLYEAKRKGFDMAKIRADDAKRIAGTIISDGAKFLGKHAIGITLGSGRKKNKNEEDR